MKATGIIRRIDELGRIVIPREIRGTLHISEGDPLEIFIASADQEIVLRKYDEHTVRMGIFKEALDAAEFVRAQDRTEFVALINAAKRLLEGGSR